MRRADAGRVGGVLLALGLATELMMLAGADCLFAAGGWLVQSAGELLRRGLVLSADDVAHFAPGEALTRNGFEILLPLASLFALGIVASFAGPARIGSSGRRGTEIGRG